jgi:caa(3)-type oxidase subunit IV
MSASHASPHGHDEHVGMSTQGYLVVFALLMVFTVVSFFANDAAQQGSITAMQSFNIILGVAVIKAVLVATFFMHLKWDWGRLYFVIVPVSIVAVLLIVVLLPDIVFAWHVGRG